MIYYKEGQTIDLKYNGRINKYCLFSYLGEFRSKNGTAKFKLAKPTEEGKELVYYEVWEVLDLESGMKDIKKLPVYVFEDKDPEQANKDRNDVINDLNEVTSLLDDYECWKHYTTLKVPAEAKRNNKNFHLDIINDIHTEQIRKLKDLDSDPSLPKLFKKGIRLKLIQKESPTHEVRRDFNIWKEEFPEFFTKLQTYVYTSNDNINVDDSHTTGIIV